jgi:chromosome partitioning protein
MDKIVTVTTGKGGATKTTSSMYLAMAAKLREPSLPVRVLDTDAHSNAALWALSAQQAGHPLPFDVQDAKLLDLRMLGQDGFQGLTIVDTSADGEIRATAVQAADFVVIPTCDSSLDLMQALGTMSAISHGMASVLVARAETTTKSCKATIGELDHRGIARFEAVVRKRQEIKNAMGSVPDKLYEYAQAYDELHMVLTQSDK